MSKASDRRDGVPEEQRGDGRASAYAATQATASSRSAIEKTLV